VHWLHLETTYRILQHGSTAVGLIILSIVVWRYLRGTPPIEEEPATSEWLPAAYAVTLAGGVALAFCMGLLWRWGVGTSVVRAIDAAIVITLVSVISVPLR